MSVAELHPRPAPRLRAVRPDPPAGRRPNGRAEPELPSLGALEILEVLSRRRRIGMAAGELGLSHAAVSQAVTRLERRLGVPLFNKNNFGVEPTPSCDGLVQAYLNAASTLRRALREAAEGWRCQALVPLAVWRWASPAIARLRDRFPDLSVSTCHDARSDDLAGADFAILPGDRAPPPGFDAAPLYDERLVPVCSPAYARSAGIDGADALARADLLIERPDAWLRWFARAGQLPEPALSGLVLADAALALEAAIAGQGVALCCSLAAAAAIARGDLVVPVDVSIPSGHRWQAIWRVASPQRQTALALLDACLAQLDAMTTRNPASRHQLHP